MKPFRFIALSGSVSLRNVAFALAVCMALITIVSVAQAFNSWAVNDRLGKLEKVMAGQFADWENRKPMTEMIEQMQKDMKDQSKQTENFVEISKGALESIQKVAEIQAGRKGIIRRVEEDSKQRDQKNATEIEKLKAKLANIEWVIQTQRTSPKEKPAKGLFKPAR